MKQVFADIDTDRSNTIDKREFRQAMKILKIQLTDFEVDSIFDRYDKRGSGSIEYREFLALIQYEQQGGRK